MTLLHTLRPQYSQPQSAPVVARPGVLSLLVPGIGDVASGGRFTLGAGGLMEPSEQGQTLRGSATLQAGTLAPTWAGLSELTLIMVMRVNSWISTDDRIFRIGDHLWGNNAFGMIRENTVLQTRIRGPSGGQITRFPLPIVGQWIVVTVRATRTIHLWANPISLLYNGVVQVGTTAGNDWSGGVFGAVPAELLQWGDGNGSTGTNINLACLAVCNSWLPDNVVTRLRTPTDVWQYVTEPRRVWVPGSAAGVPLEGAATATATATGALTVAVPLAGAGLAVATATGALSVSIRLAGAGTATATATGGLSLSIPLSGAAVAQALASAALTQAVPLAGAAAAAATAAGDLTINVSLAGSAIAQAVAAADLTVTTAGAVNLAGAATATAAATGTLRLDVPLSGAALTLSSASGTLTQIVALSGAAAVASSATGGLDVSVRLSGAALVSALASAGLTVTTPGLAGAAVASADAAGTLTLRLNLDGAAVARAVASGMLTAEGLIPAGTPGWTITAGARDWKITAGARDWRIAE